jgi:hypothetical protein
MRGTCAFLRLRRTRTAIAPAIKANPRTAPNAIPAFAPVLKEGLSPISTPIFAARDVAYALGKFDKSLDCQRTLTGSANSLPDASNVGELYVVPDIIVSHAVGVKSRPELSANGASAVKGVVNVP